MLNSILAYLPTFSFRDPDWLWTLGASAVVVLVLWLSFLLGRREGLTQAQKMLEKGQSIFDKLNEIFLTAGDLQGIKDEAEPIHHYFELSYAQYLAIPRSILQNMPMMWQRVFVALLIKLDNHFDWRRPGMWVRFQNSDGRYMKDDLADYERGGRLLSPEAVHEISERARARYDGKA